MLALMDAYVNACCRSTHRGQYPSREPSCVPLKSRLLMKNFISMLAHLFPCWLRFYRSIFMVIMCNSGPFGDIWGHYAEHVCMGSEMSTKSAPKIEISS